LAGAGLSGWRRLFVVPDAPQEQGAGQVGGGIHGDGAGGAERHDEGAAGVGADEVGQGVAGAHLGVAVLDSARAEEGGQETDGRVTADDLHGGHCEGDRVEMDQGDAGEKLCGGKGEEDSGAEQIAGDDQGTFAPSVGQDAGVEGQQQGGEFGGKGDQRDVEGGGVQFDDG
jgi:hypothetical protein